jgi:hypothetical protein
MPDVRARLHRLWWRIWERPRVVVWGGRERDVVVGTPFDLARAVWLDEIERLRRDAQMSFARPVL